MRTSDRQALPSPCPSNANYRRWFAVKSEGERKKASDGVVKRLVAQLCPGDPGAGPVESRFLGQSPFPRALYRQDQERVIDNIPMTTTARKRRWHNARKYARCSGTLSFLLSTILSSIIIGWDFGLIASKIYFCQIESDITIPDGTFRRTVSSRGREV